MRIVLTGSGSGGHFYPLMAIAGALTERAQLEKRTPPELYLFAPDPYDSGVLFEKTITYIHIPGGKIRRYFSFKNILDIFKTIFGTFVAIYHLFVIYPDVVVSKGSYTSVPVVLAAFVLRIPIVIHESDVFPGRANKLAARFTKTIAISYERTTTLFPKRTPILTGIPMRKELTEKQEGSPSTTLGIEIGRPLILFLGGSQGAERINDLVVTALNELLPNYNILHQVGEQNAPLVTEMAQALVDDKEALKRYYVREFLDAKSMSAAYKMANIIVSRAGSTSIHEIALSEKPSIVIPIPEDISHDQRVNAYEYARTGASSVIEEKNLTPHLLVAEINRIMNDPALQTQMKDAARTFAPKDGASKLATIIQNTAQSHL